MSDAAKSAVATHPADAGAAVGGAAWVCLGVCDGAAATAAGARAAGAIAAAGARGHDGAADGTPAGAAVDGGRGGAAARTATPPPPAPPVPPETGLRRRQTIASGKSRALPRWRPPVSPVAIDRREDGRPPPSHILLPASSTATATCFSHSPRAEARTSQGRR